MDSYLDNALKAIVLAMSLALVACYPSVRAAEMTAVERILQADPDLKVAFIGDSSYWGNFDAVLRLRR